MLRNDPNIWRERAEETRVLAESFTDSVARESMFKVAAAYERIAQRAEKQPLRQSQISNSVAVGRSILMGIERLHEIAAREGDSALPGEMRRIAAELAKHAAQIEAPKNSMSDSDRVSRKSAAPTAAGDRNRRVQPSAARSSLAVPRTALYRHRRRNQAD